MEPDDGRRDGGVDPEQRRCGRGRSRRYTASGSTAAAAMLPSETYPVSRTSTAQTTADDPQRERRQPEHDPRGGRDALPALEPDEHREHVAHDRRDAAGQREELGVGYPGSEDQHRDGALGDVDEADRNRVLPAEHSIEVGGAEIPAAVLPKIDAGEEATEQMAGRDRADEIGGEQPETAEGSAPRSSSGELEPQRRSGERPGLPEAVRQVALVGLRHVLGPIAHDGEGRRRGADLRGVEQLDLLPRLLRWRVTLEQGGQHLVDLRRGDPALPAFGHLEDEIEHLAHPLPGERRDVQEGHVAKKRRLGDQRLLPLARGVGVLLLHQVPLVHHDDQPGALIPGLGRDAEILVVEAQRRVHHQHAT